MSEIKKNIQKNISKFRKRAGLTQKELSSQIGVPVTSLASWEQGKSLPDIDTLFSLCSHLDTDIATISGFELSSTEPNDKNGFRRFRDGMIEMNNHCAKLGSELSLLVDEQQLIEDYRTFNNEGKEKIRDYVSDLKCNAKYKKCSESALDKQA